MILNLLMIRLQFRSHQDYIHSVLYIKYSSHTGAYFMWPCIAIVLEQNFILFWELNSFFIEGQFYLSMSFYFVKCSWTWSQLVLSSKKLNSSNHNTMDEIITRYMYIQVTWHYHAMSEATCKTSKLIVVFFLHCPNWLTFLHSLCIFF